ncbi:NAD-dependent epimerase/dehydratase family protein [Pseudenhygromyxa sp. WMMC2535]|uniref:NAD-dependent epimerase/dehydratase family protein n=1 Tax=Pseudenhygromyxa sp. WMMC2535 TaxID=2712867 RepID=UPI001556BEBB|nr:NAD-dependent epimerase/dehydratase family protein [Pseudenhygromyxa sp. WMMC2535]NVB42813.1 NAD-dependent epimerase/dehydratase family protein [Pseudenhygromyxa sp. WMMC2535]
MSETDETETINAPAGIPTGKVLVTGGSGHLGNNLVHLLLEDGHDVRVLVQPGADNRGLDGLEVERVEGDLRDPASLRRAVDGVTRVFHAAAMICTASATPAEQHKLYAINVLGTRDLLRASLEAGVARFVLTGSFSATGFDLDDPSKPSAPTQPFFPFAHAMPYAHTKALAEHELLKACAEGLDAVIATSCGCIGAWDYLPSRMGGTLCDYVEGRLRVYVDGGFTWVRAQDVARGHLLAMERGRKGQKYLFATQFMTLAQLFETAAELTGVEHGLVELPLDLVGKVAALYSGTLAHLFPKASQRLTPGSIAVLRMRRRVDISRAQRELGFEPTSLRTAIHEALDFYARQGMLSRAPLTQVPRTDLAGSAAQ